MTTQYKYPEGKISFGKTRIQPSSDLMNRGKKLFDIAVTDITNQQKRMNTDFVYLQIMTFIRCNELKNIKDFIDKYTVNLSCNLEDTRSILNFNQDTIKIKPTIRITMEVRKKYQRKQYNIMKFVDWYEDRFF